MADPFRVRCDQAARILTEHLVQPGYRDTAAGNQFTQYRPRPNGRQLVSVPDQYNLRAGPGGVEQMSGQINIQHGNLIHQNQVRM